ncbi:MAG: hypothetical protein ACRC8C_01220 [Mycoplasmoidaceae bacterium]
MNNIFFIDTCNSRLVLSLIIDNEIIDTLYFQTNKNMTEIFNTKVDLFLKNNNFYKKNISHIYVLNGPGSFVGIKVGLVFTNLFAKLNNSKIYFLDTCSFQKTNEKQISIIDAKGSLYYCKFDKKEITLETIERINDIAKEKGYEILNNSENYIFEECWNYNNNKFIETEEVIGNYVKKAI